MTDRPTNTRDVQELLKLVRPAVRRENIYAVETFPDLTAKLNQNESAFDLPSELKRAVIERLESVHWNRYPTDYADPAREALARSLGIYPDQIILANGSNDLIQAVASAIVSSGTSVVLPDPVFSLYAKAVRLLEGRLVNVDCRRDLRIDVDGIIHAARQSASPVVMLTNPGSPTGTVVDSGEIARIADEAPGFVLVDEAYHEFVSAPSALDLLAGRPNLLILRTFSKAMGLAGLRIGYLVGHPDVVNEIRKLRLPFVVNVLSEATLLAVLEHPSYVRERVAEVVREREALYGNLACVDGVEVHRSDTNFMIFRTPVPSSELVRRLAERGVLIRDVGGYTRLTNFVRVTVGTPGENQAFLVALISALKDTRV